MMLHTYDLSMHDRIAIFIYDEMSFQFMSIMYLSID